MEDGTIFTFMVYYAMKEGGNKGNTSNISLSSFSIDFI